MYVSKAANDSKHPDLCKYVVPLTERFTVSIYLDSYGVHALPDFCYEDTVIMIYNGSMYTGQGSNFGENKGYL